MTFQDYSAPLGEPMTQRFIRRHRLEKRDPNAAMSEPVEPIVYYLDPGTPEPVRSALLDGARWWNQAFEAAGFIDAFRVEIRPDDVSSHDVRYNVINWVHRSTRGWSTGGSITDPRTGEILKGTVTLGSLRVRQDYLIAEGLLAPYENGDEEPAGLAEWALARIRQLSAHEVGHTIGTVAQLLRQRGWDGSRCWTTRTRSSPTTAATSTIPRSTTSTSASGTRSRYATATRSSRPARTRPPSWSGSSTRPGSRTSASSATRMSPRTRGRTNGPNGTDAGAELDRMLDVRRAALERFGERAIRAGRPWRRWRRCSYPSTCTTATR